MVSERIHIDTGAIIFRRPNRPTWYLDLNTSGRRSRFSLETTLKGDALQRAKSYLERMTSQKWGIARAATISFKEAVDIYFSEHAEVYNAPSTIYLYQNTLSLFRTYLDSQINSTKTTLLENISQEDILQFMKERSSYVSQTTVNIDRRNLNAFFNFALRKGLAKSNPVAYVAPFRTVKKLPKFPTTEEIQRILEESQKPIPCLGPGHKGN